MAVGGPSVDHPGGVTEFSAVRAYNPILAIAQSVGLPLSELINGIKRPQKEKATVAVQYRHPDDATLQWTGRGRQPKWIKEWVDAGKSLDLVRV
jgi:DNA-binding protein H-NS